MLYLPSFPPFLHPSRSFPFPSVPPPTTPFKLLLLLLKAALPAGAGWRGEAGRGGVGHRISQDPMTWVRHVTVAQERKSIHERMRSTGVDYRLGPWLLEGWREMEEV